MRVAAFCLLWSGVYAARACADDAASFEVRTDISQAPDAAEYAGIAKSLCEEWYPKINIILFGASHPLPYKQIVISIDQEKRYAQEHVIGFAAGNTIHLKWDWVKQRPGDYEGAVIHELAHVNQEYGNFHIRHDRLLAPIRPLRIKMSQEYRMNWLVEGIADYIRFAYFEKKLGMDVKEFAKLRCKGYRKGYGITAAFLLWLEFTKDKDIVRRLNEKLEQRRYTSRIFKRNCGAPLDHLWGEFIEDVVAQRWPTRPAV